MNAINRKMLSAIADELEELKDRIENILEDEESKRDNTPDNLLGSEQYERRVETCDNLSDAVNGLESVIESINAAAE